MNDFKRKIITLDDVILTHETFLGYLSSQGIDYTALEDEAINEIKQAKLPKELEERNIASVKNSYIKQEKRTLLASALIFFENEIALGQIKFETVFEWIESNLKKLEEKFKITFTKQERWEVAFNIQQKLFGNLVDITTSLYSEKELKLLKERAEKVKKDNRSFHRGTPISDDIEVKGE